MTTRLTLERGEWYGLTMWPGYMDEPYHSPIRIESVVPVAGRARQFDLEFLNEGYAAGVQIMTYRLITLRRESRYILAAVGDSDRSVAIVPLTDQWRSAHGWPRRATS